MQYDLKIIIFILIFMIYIVIYILHYYFYQQAWMCISSLVSRDVYDQSKNIYIYIYLCSLLCNLPLKLMLKLEMIQRRAILTLYKVKFSSIVSISTLMRSLNWLKFRYLCRYRLLCITHKVIYLRFSEYLADLISIQILSRASRKCHTMKIVQCCNTGMLYHMTLGV